MKKIIAFISAFFLMLSITAEAAFTGEEIYSSVEKSFDWLKNNVSPLGNTDSVSADYYVMALSRGGKSFDYNKYSRITQSRDTKSVRDAQRTIMANAVCGGKLNKEFVFDNTLGSYKNDSLDISSALIAAVNGGYSTVEYENEIDKAAALLLGNQLPDGSFGGDVVTTAKSVIALSFCSGKRYSVNGKHEGESYFYDVNNAMLRAVNYLQNNKNEDYGFGNVSDTAYVIMALDCSGIDADNDLGFSDGGKSTFSWLMMQMGDDGRFADAENTATAVCAIVSHMLAMQGREPFFNLRSEDRLKNPSNYTADINRSGEGFKKMSSQEIIEIDFKTDDTESATAATDENDDVLDIKDKELTKENKQEDNNKTLTILLVIASIIAVIAVSAGFIIYYVHSHPEIKRRIKRKDRE